MKVEGRKRFPGLPIKQFKPNRPRSTYKARQIHNPESKVILTSGSLPFATNNYQAACINPSQQGADEGDFIGMQSLIKSVQVRYFASTGSDPVRVMVVVDKEHHGGYAPTGLDWDKLMELKTSVLTLRNHNYSKRFKVIFDDYVQSFNGDGIAGEHYNKVNIPVQYDASGHVAYNWENIYNGAVYLAVICENSANTVHYHAQVKYIDN